jgi:cell division septation protein DedD
MNILAFLVLLSGIAISICGAYFSIIGLKLLFVGGGLSIIIMGTALEIGKIITATFLKQKWKEIGWWMKSYMLLATLFLMGITSIGIYGYLSAGYTATSIAVQGYEQNIESNNTKIAEFEKEIETIKKSDYNSEEIAGIDANRKKFIEQKLQVVAQKNQQIESIRKSANTTQDASADIAAAKQALEISKSSTDTDIARELEQIKLFNARLEILDKEVQKWMDQGTGGLFGKNGLNQARVVKEGQAKERAEIDEKIKSSQDRITKLREQYASQMKEYNDRVAVIETRSKGQRGDIEANIKKLEKDIEEIMASIDAYNKESDNKVSSLNSKKDELAEAGKKKVIEYQNEIQALRNQNTDYKDKIVKTDVGTFKFIAKSLGVPLDTAVNYFIWSIMLVFDPLAVCLILAYNTLVGKKKEQILPVATPVITPTPTAIPEPTITPSPTPSATPEPTPSPTPEPTPEPSQQIEQKDPYNEQLQNRIEPAKANSTEAPPEAFIRDYEHFSRPNP